MRNIFDQYDQPENKLSHALATCLHEDRKLLPKFIQWVLGKGIPGTGNFEVLEQQIPGEKISLSGDESDISGLPDIWIHDSDRWSLIIENKIALAVDNDQLRRHYQTALKRGFENIHIVVIGPLKPKRKLIDRAQFKHWSEIYSWLIKQSNSSPWAHRTTKYFEIAETKFADTGYLKEGTLTEFSGFHFDEKNPYNYLEAKRVLRLAMEDLRKNKKLCSTLGIGPNISGRSKLTGKEDSCVWDYLALAQSDGQGKFNEFPHFTLLVGEEALYPFVGFPNEIKSKFRRNLLNGGKEQFLESFYEILQDMEKTTNNVVGATPWVRIKQRHFPSRRSIPISDAVLEFDLRTARKDSGDTTPKGSAVKCQPIWLDALYELFKSNQGNIELNVGIQFKYAHCQEVKSPKILDVIAETWITCRPLIKVAVG